MFNDRYDAAQQLTSFLEVYHKKQDVLVVAIPRGGLEPGSVLAEYLGAPLSVVLVKKIGAPENPELAIGALSLHEEEIDSLYVSRYSQETLNAHIEEIRTVLQKRMQHYGPYLPKESFGDKVIILVDDGVATGHTLLLALKELKRYKPKKIIVTLPVCPQELVATIKQYADEVYCLLTPATFTGVSQFYRYFPQVSDEQAIALLQRTNS